MDKNDHRTSPAALDDVCEIFCYDEEKVARWRDKVPATEGLAELFKVLADPTRSKLVYILAHEELCVCDLATILGASVSNISHHLRVLRAASLVKKRKEGKQVFYSLDDEHVVRLVSDGFDHVRHTHD